MRTKTLSKRGFIQTSGEVSLQESKSDTHTHTHIYISFLFLFFLFFMLNIYFIAQKNNSKYGRNKQIEPRPISNKGLRYMKRHIEDGNRPKPVYKSCPLCSFMYIADHFYPLLLSNFFNFNIF